MRKLAKGKNSSKGRGWHGDSKGHAEAGRKGGRASSKSRKSNKSSNQENENWMEEV